MISHSAAIGFGGEVSLVEAQFAKALSPGDTIAIVAPAGPLDRERIERATERLESMGFKVQAGPGLYRANDYLAGSDEQRSNELMAAFADAEVDGIFPGTGGYGTTRILDRLDYDVIRRNPKVFIGFSDITALHITIFQRTGLVTFHSPNPQWGLGSPEDLAPIAGKFFWRAILASKYKNAAGPAQAGYAIRVSPVDVDVPQPTTLSAGAARGRLIGGNLSLVHALMGTPYEIETEGRILFLEDVGEAPYRVDRMLQTLKSAGKLQKPAGVVLGAFTRREEEDTEGEVVTIDEVLSGFFADAPYPVLAGFPVGHQRNNVTLPVGAQAELDASGKTLRLLENPVVVPRTQ
ncbi:MAG: LD-carboxypeptidase [Planctomycetales bacterium]|nr:LD-carboxypeptidase [Planctomycetales bacterium]